MIPRLVYNGATGGLGRHIGAALLDAGLPATSLASRLGDAGGLIDELEHLPIEPGVPLVFIQSAGMVSVAECEEHPGQAFEINVSRTTDTVRDFLEWAVDRDIVSGVVFVSSGHVYAPSEREELLAESSPTDPRSVYAQTKLEGETRILALAEAYGAGLAIGRVFGMIGPHQRPHYLLPGLIRRVQNHDLAAIPGLDYVRDYLDARDVARHLASLAVAAGENPGRSTTVNVCSGEPTRIGDLLEQVLETHFAGDPDALEAARQSVSAAPGRDSDVTWSVGDPTVLSENVPGPVRSIPIIDTLTEALSTGSP